MSSKKQVRPEGDAQDPEERSGAQGWKAVLLGIATIAAEELLRRWIRGDRGRGGQGMGRRSAQRFRS